MPGVVMTAARVKRAEEMAPTHTLGEAAKALGVGYRTLLGWALRYRVTFRKGRIGRPPRGDRPMTERERATRARVVAMTPERVEMAWRLLEAGASRKQAAARLGVSEKTAGSWAKQQGREWVDGRIAANNARRDAIARMGAAAAAARRLPLNDVERAMYQRIRQQGAGLVTRDDAFRAIGRPDLAQNTPGASSSPQGVRPPRAAPCRAAATKNQSAVAGTK